jgi:hypothetical protein
VPVVATAVALEVCAAGVGVASPTRSTLFGAVAGDVPRFSTVVAVVVGAASVAGAAGVAWVTGRGTLGTVAGEMSVAAAAVAVDLSFGHW